MAALKSATGPAGILNGSSTCLDLPSVPDAANSMAHFRSTAGSSKCRLGGNTSVYLSCSDRSRAEMLHHENSVLLTCEPGMGTTGPKSVTERRVAGCVAA